MTNITHTRKFVFFFLNMFMVILICYKQIKEYLLFQNILLLTLYDK